MMALPAASWSYGVRTVVTAALLVCCWFRSRSVIRSRSKVEVDKGGSVLNDAAGTPRLQVCPLKKRTPLSTSTSPSTCLLSIGVGLAVLLVWVAPDGWAWYRRWCVIGDPYGASAVAPTGWLLWLRLFGSAFVISAAEELFFREWLIGFAGFGWMVALFAVEHDRWLVGAIAGVLYGLLYLRRGLFAAIAAHATTNLLLGLYVIKFNHWEFW